MLRWKNKSIIKCLNNQITHFNSFEKYCVFCNCFLFMMHKDGHISIKEAQEILDIVSNNNKEKFGNLTVKKLSILNDNDGEKDIDNKKLDIYNSVLYDKMLYFVLCDIAFTDKIDIDYLYDKNQRLFPDDKYVIIEDDSKFKVLDKTFEYIFDQLYKGKYTFDYSKIKEFLEKNNIPYSLFRKGEKVGLRIPKDFKYRDLQDKYGNYNKEQLAFINCEKLFFTNFNFQMKNYREDYGTTMIDEKSLDDLFNNFSTKFNMDHFKNICKAFITVHEDDIRVDISKLNKFILDESFDL